MQPLAISRYTLANCLGAGVAATLAAMRDQRSGLSRCAFADVELDTWVGTVGALDAPVREELRAYDCRNNRLAELALAQDDFAAAVAAARDKYGATRIGVFMGTSTSGILATEEAYRRRLADGALPADFNYSQTQNTYSLADFTQRVLGLAGPAMVVSSACSSTAKVFGHAQRMLAAGFIDAAVVGGVDSLCLTTLYGFNSLGLVSPQPCRPFGAGRDGISIGEGAGFALLERMDAAPHAPRLLGVGESSDAYHMSSPHPEGEGAHTAMRRALDAARLTPSDIGYINLHGTATPANDASEDKAVVRLFGEKTPASSTKGAHGHLLGAAGITEAIIGLLAIANNFMPAGLNTTEVDGELKTDYLLQNREGRVGAVLSNSFGFGGSNCAVVLGGAA
ncbi:MAG: Beta-ketoacyl synthase [Betaproteobacteria bacterium]|nr:Beta-ketoacyl synthase [Betaproteobacteria bacterium]